MRKFYTVEGTNAWGVTSFMSRNFSWTFIKAEAARFNTAEEAVKALEQFNVPAHVECYSDEYLHLFK